MHSALLVLKQCKKAEARIFMRALAFLHHVNRIDIYRNPNGGSDGCLLSPGGNQAVEITPVYRFEQDLAPKTIAQPIDGGGYRTEYFDPNLQFRFESHQ
jgi:hypothetical protein